MRRLVAVSVGGGDDKLKCFFVASVVRLLLILISPASKFSYTQPVFWFSIKLMEKNQTITLGGGCFWCIEAIYQRIRGVTSVESGYSGGITENPTMDEVYGGGTKHAEVVQIEFDPKIITLKDILEIFFTMHDPTTLDRQGNDVGDEYRSVIFYRNDEQKAVAEDMIKNFAPTLWDDPVVTGLVKFDKFWSAGVDQQDYFNNHPEAAYCQIVINPKVQKLRQKYAERLIKD